MQAFAGKRKETFEKFVSVYLPRIESQARSVEALTKSAIAFDDAKQELLCAVYEAVCEDSYDEAQQTMTYLFQRVCWKVGNLVEKHSRQKRGAGKVIPVSRFDALRQDDSDDVTLDLLDRDDRIEDLGVFANRYVTPERVFEARDNMSRVLSAARCEEEPVRQVLQLMIDPPEEFLVYLGRRFELGAKRTNRGLETGSKKEIEEYAGVNWRVFNRALAVAREVLSE